MIRLIRAVSPINLNLRSRISRASISVIELNGQLVI